MSKRPPHRDDYNTRAEWLAAYRFWESRGNSPTPPQPPAAA